MGKLKMIDVEQAARELHECGHIQLTKKLRELVQHDEGWYNLIEVAGEDAISSIYEDTFDNVETCRPSEDDPDTLIIEYVKGCEPKE